MWTMLVARIIDGETDDKSLHSNINFKGC